MYITRVNHERPAPLVIGLGVSFSSTQQEGSPMATFPRKLALSLIAALAVAMTACSPEEQGGPPPTPAVTVAVLGAQDVTLTRELPGRTNAWLVAEVRPQVSGLIAERLFTEGERVEKGQPRSEEHTSELQSRPHVVCRLLLVQK